MNQPRLWSALTLLIGFAAGLEAQPPFTIKRVVHPLAPPDRESTLSQISTAGAQIKLNPPQFACSTLVVRTGRFGSSIGIDFAYPRQGANDWERFKTEDAYRGSVETRQKQGQFDLTPLLAEVFSPDVQFMVDGWSSVNHRLVAVARYSGDGRQASVYVDPNSGSIMRIALHGFAAPEHVKSLQCWPESR